MRSSCCSFAREDEQYGFSIRTWFQILIEMKQPIIVFWFYQHFPIQHIFFAWVRAKYRYRLNTQYGIDDDIQIDKYNTKMSLPMFIDLRFFSPSRLIPSLSLWLGSFCHIKYSQFEMVQSSRYSSQFIVRYRLILFIISSLNFQWFFAISIKCKCKCIYREIQTIKELNNIFGFFFLLFMFCAHEYSTANLKTFVAIRVD